MPLGIRDSRLESCLVHVYATDNAEQAGALKLSIVSSISQLSPLATGRFAFKMQN